MIRTGLQRYEVTFAMDLEDDEENDGQSAKIPSLCGTAGVIWKFECRIKENGKLYAGIVMPEGGEQVPGWKSCTLKIFCPEIKSRLLRQRVYTPAKELLPPLV